MMIFLALYSRAQLLLSVREKARRKTAPLFSNSRQSALLFGEKTERPKENDAFRMKDTHATTTTPNRFRIKSQRRGKMFDEFFLRLKNSLTHSVVSRVNEEAHERHSDIPLISRVVRGRVGERCALRQSHREMMRNYEYLEEL